MNKQRKSWPDWQTPDNKELIVLAKTLMPHIKILSPEIIKIIAEENNKNLTHWTTALEKLGNQLNLT